MDPVPAAIGWQDDVRIEAERYDSGDSGLAFRHSRPGDLPTLSIVLKAPQGFPPAADRELVAALNATVVGMTATEIRLSPAESHHSH